jgi:hypothetical protein
MVVEFTTTCAIIAYHHLSCELEPHSWRSVLDKTLCDKVCQWLATGLWISLGTPISANHDGLSSVKMKGNCFIDIDGIYDYHCL